eukprot:1149083-Pelagomonas_calceolata.AAC.2
MRAVGLSSLTASQGLHCLSASLNTIQRSQTASGHAIFHTASEHAPDHLFQAASSWLAVSHAL